MDTESKSGIPVVFGSLTTGSNHEPTFFLTPDFPKAADLDPAAMAETLEAARLAKIQADSTRDFVLAHYQKLRGQVMPMEILGIQNLPHHNCLIVNDLLLLSYVEAEQIIRKLAGENDA